MPKSPRSLKTSRCFILNLIMALAWAILFGWSVSLEASSRIALYILGVTSEVGLLSSIYLLMPAVRTTFRHALIGGITATILWEITRRVLVWYYSTLSMVNLIYGSFATAVVTLLITEAAAVNPVVRRSGYSRT